VDPLSLLDHARVAGLAVAREGDKLIVRGPKHAEPVVRLLAAHKSEILTALADATSWRARHREALAYWGTLHPAEEAARLAWGEMQNRWHQLYGARAPEWRCAGCGKPIGGLPSMALADRNRVHVDKFGCLERFGERWRGEATAGLRALGLAPPEGIEP
jgi:hypothetical protein